MSSTTAAPTASLLAKKLPTRLGVYSILGLATAVPAAYATYTSFQWRQGAKDGDRPLALMTRNQTWPLWTPAKQ